MIIGCACGGWLELTLLTGSIVIGYCFSSIVGYVKFICQKIGEMK